MGGGEGETSVVLPPPQPSKSNARTPTIPKAKKTPTTSTLLRQRSACSDSTGLRNLWVTVIRDSLLVTHDSLRLNGFAGLLRRMSEWGKFLACYLNSSTSAGNILLAGPRHY